MEGCCQPRVARGSDRSRMQRGRGRHRGAPTLVRRDTSLDRHRQHVRVDRWRRRPTSTQALVGDGRRCVCDLLPRGHVEQRIANAVAVVAAGGLAVTLVDRTAGAIFSTIFGAVGLVVVAYLVACRGQTWVVEPVPILRWFVSRMSQARKPRSLRPRPWWQACGRTWRSQRRALEQRRAPCNRASSTGCGPVASRDPRPRDLGA